MIAGDGKPLNAMTSGPLANVSAPYSYTSNVVNRLNPTTNCWRGKPKSNWLRSRGRLYHSGSNGRRSNGRCKDAGKTAVLGYVADAILPGSGNIVRFLSKFI